MPTLRMNSCIRRHDKNPKELDRRLQHKIAIANNWYEQKGMIVNPDKHQTIVLGNTDYFLSNFLSPCGTQLIYWVYLLTII